MINEQPVTTISTISLDKDWYINFIKKFSTRTFLNSTASSVRLKTLSRKTNIKKAIAKFFCVTHKRKTTNKNTHWQLQSVLRYKQTQKYWNKNNRLAVPKRFSSQGNAIIRFSAFRETLKAWQSIETF